VKFGSYDKSQRDALFLNFILVKSSLPKICFDKELFTKIKLRNSASRFTFIVRMYHDARSSECQMKFGILILFENVSRKLKLPQYLTRITGTLHEDLCTIVVESRLVLLRMGTILYMGRKTEGIVAFPLQ
jgi:hypothetical protein